MLQPFQVSRLHEPDMNVPFVRAYVHVLNNWTYGFHSGCWCQRQIKIATPLCINEVARVTSPTYIQQV
jgi:hypothetical protein